MDRSFLTNDQVIKASRNFVCIRLATYEDEAEAEFLKTVYVNSEGELDNTVFVLLSPDTKTNLCRAGRSPNFAFRTPSALAVAMDQLSFQYSGSKRADDVPQALPQMKNFRLGLNVSSCDGLPTVVCVGKDESEVAALNAKLVPLAFSHELAGKFGFASATVDDDFSQIEGYQSEQGFLLIQPGEFGIDGKLVKAFAADVQLDELQSALARYVGVTDKVVKNHSSHVRAGRKSGASWETELPVTDPGSLRAMQRDGVGPKGVPDQSGSRRSGR